MTRTKTQYVRWTGEEQHLVVTAAAARLGGASRKTITTRTLLHVMRSVQEELLPKERQRVLISHENFKNMLPQLDLALKRYKAPVVEKAVLPEAVPLEPVEPVPAPTLDPKAELFAMLDKFIDAIAYRVADVIEQRAQAKNAVPVAPVVPIVQVAAAEPVAKHVATYNPVKKMSRLSVGVIGLMNNQQHILASKFSNVCFKFFDKKLPKQLPCVDYMIGMVGFLSHLTAGNASKAYGLRYIRISNGMSSLEGVVSDLQKKYVPTEKKS